MIKYKWTPGSRSNIDPEVAGKELERIRGSGIITAKAVVSAATKATSPLHKHFEWDDGVAADEYRLEQARYLLRSIRVIVEQPDNQKDKLVRVYINPLNEGTYHIIADVLDDDTLRDRALLKVMRELKAMSAKNQEYEDLFGVLVEAEQKVEKLVVTKPPYGMTVENLRHPMDN